MDSPPLPQLIVIGAAKAATTWIAHQLRTRPDVCMPGPEPHYFSREFDRGEQWYRSLFAGARPGQLVAEKSADYLAHAEAPARIAALLPSVRLIAQLRNPVERAYSDYCMLFRRGQVDGDVDRHLDGARAPERRFLEDGLYGRHIQRFLDHFPQEQLEIILHDEIKRDPAAVTANLLRMLGLPPRIDGEAIERRVNDGASPVVPLALRRLPAPVKRLADPLRGNPLFERARRMIARPVHYPPLTDDTRRRLADFYRDDVEQLGRTLGRDLGAWTNPAPAAS
ncbi:sulfotransferase domain-containing protein [Sphingomonas sp. BT-65]|uniref:sulfotransferase family protein n=1 Tax=Sphingomonas sp. BT-65 TaxID=2989821 RepID=UPI002235A367|nr:sulfotransferase [Sphingomonas sp. BT-65]MCW4463441.1 sulfotransferase domain-containing protein [Sphingomonas sp. BT-65]